MSFIRFTPINYLLQNQLTPVVFPDIDDCDTNEVYLIPAKPQDTFKFIVDKSTVEPLGTSIENIKIAITKCGALLLGFLDVGTVVETELQYFISVTLPLNLPDSEYNFVIYNNIDPINCGQFKGMTLGQVIDSGVTLGQVLQCTLTDFIP